ncbi:MAG: ribosomal protein L7/L12 [Myxococcota bacterium]
MQEQQQRIEELLASPDIAQIRQGIFLLESLDSPELLHRICDAYPIQSLVFPHASSRTFRPGVEAVVALRIHHLLARHRPNIVIDGLYRELCLRRLDNRWYRAELDLVSQGGHRWRLAAGTPGLTPEDAFAHATPLLGQVGPASLAEVVDALARNFLEGIFPRPLSALTNSTAQRLLRRPGPWRLSMFNLDPSLLEIPGVLSRLSYLSLWRSTVTHLPVDGHAGLVLDTTGSQLAELPSWAQQVLVDTDGWERWWDRMEQVHTLKIEGQRKFSMSETALPSLRHLRIRTRDLSSVLSWLVATPRSLERLVLGGEPWTPPEVFWTLPIREMMLEGAIWDWKAMPAQPPEHLSLLEVNVSQFYTLPKAWQPRARLWGGRCQVFLERIGSQKVACIKFVRELTGLWLREAKELVEAAPCRLWTAHSRREALHAVQALHELGASASLRME